MDDEEDDLESLPTAARVDGDHTEPQVLDESFLGHAFSKVRNHRNWQLFVRISSQSNNFVILPFD